MTTEIGRRGLYVHIPFCTQKCGYCDFVSYPGQQDYAAEYIDALLGEARLWRAQFPGFAPDTVFFGGGTPSLLPAAEFARLMEGLQHIFGFAGLLECTVEANPGTVDAQKARVWAHCGVNRVSLGLQAAQPEILRSIGRVHTPGQFVQALNACKTAGIANINGDMMTGLPGQNRHDALETAAFLADEGVCHISCYALHLEEGTPLEAAVARGAVALPGDEAERDMFHAAADYLRGQGFERYEISNFAMPGQESMHNLVYWRRGEYIGLGCAAAAYMGGVRSVNAYGLEEYMRSIMQGVRPVAQAEDITADEAAFEAIMLGTRLREGVHYARFACEHGFDLRTRYAQVLSGLQDSGWAQRDTDYLRLTDAGMDMQNTVLLEFMP